MDGDIPQKPKLPSFLHAEDGPLTQDLVRAPSRFGLGQRKRLFEPDPGGQRV